MSALDTLYPIPCPFCTIVSAHPAPSSPAGIVPKNPPTPDTSSPDTATPTYLILNTPQVLAFLDHAPISRGHALVIIREHRSKLADLTVDEGQAIGGWLGVLSRAVIGSVAPPAENGDGDGLPATELADDVGDWNIVQNNGARAAQVVPHVHFHIIPRSGHVPEVKARSWTIFGRGQREDLDDADAQVLVLQIRERLRRELERLRQREGDDALKLLGADPTSLKPRTKL